MAKPTWPTVCSLEMHIHCREPTIPTCKSKQTSRRETSTRKWFPEKQFDQYFPVFFFYRCHLAGKSPFKTNVTCLPADRNWHWHRSKTKNEKLSKVNLPFEIFWLLGSKLEENNELPISRRTHYTGPADRLGLGLFLVSITLKSDFKLGETALFLWKKLEALETRAAQPATRFWNRLKSAGLSMRRDAEIFPAQDRNRRNFRGIIANGRRIYNDIYY